jgi:lipopolysaccharide transport system permease protein
VTLPLLFSGVGMLRTLSRHRRVLLATTRIEMSKRYAGSSLGLGWVVLQPLLLLSVYLFVYLVVFRVRFADFGRLEYVLYVFAGLVPYIGVMEAIGASPLLLKQNMHLVRNVLIPVELLAARTVLMALANQAAGLLMVIALALVTGHATPHLLWLPVAIALQGLMLIGLVWIVSSFGVLVPDISYVVNIGLLLLLYVSPIAFTAEMVPADFRWVVFANPVTHLIEVFRASLMGTGAPDALYAAAFVLIALASFAGGAAFFRRVKGALVDYE